MECRELDREHRDLHRHHARIVLADQFRGQKVRRVEKAIAKFEQSELGMPHLSKALNGADISAWPKDRIQST